MNDPISRAEALLQNSETVTLAANGADGYPHAYVMTKLPGEGIRMIPFLAKDGSDKVRDLERDPRACVSFTAPGGSVSLTGEVSLSRDTEAMRALWVPELDRIFPAGPEGLVLLRFAAHRAVYCFMGKVEEGQL